jgi:hypothetical protein
MDEKFGWVKVPGERGSIFKELTPSEHGSSAAAASRSREDEYVAMRQFCRSIIKEYCWDQGEPDGGDIQDQAERLGLIVPHIATLQDTVRMDDVEVGDQIFVFADWMDCNDKTDAEVSVS